MKNYLIDYYAIIILALFINYNIVLNGLKISGSLYQVFMIIFIIANMIIMIVFRKHIKGKSYIIIVYFFIWLFSKNRLQCMLGVSTMVTLIITGFMESNFIKVITVLILLFFGLFSVPLSFVYFLTFGTGLSKEKGIDDIYNDTHFYCNNNYEVYSYSAGAMDGFHYSIGKHYEILNIDDIIYISYSKRNEVSKEKYENYLKNHNCILVGDINGTE